MRSNLDVWAIQHSPEELDIALAQVGEGFNIVYSNCVCDIRLGNEDITTRQFDTFLYNEESEVLILLMRGGKATKEDVVAHLEKNNKPYGEVTFDTLDDEYEDNKDIPELWFAREEYVLRDALEDGKSKNITSCIYYPLVFGSMDLGYYVNADETVRVDGRLFGGIVQQEDKLILLIDQPDNIDKNGNSRNMTPAKVLSVMNDLGIKCEISYDDNPTFTDSQKIKVL